MEASQVPAFDSSMAESWGEPQDHIFAGIPQEFQEDTRNAIHLDLTDEFTFCGAHFSLRILRPDEEMAAALAMNPWKDTIKAQEAWGNAQIALALTSINYDEDFCPPVSPDPQMFANARLRYITANFFQPVLDYVYQRYLSLLVRQKRVIDQVEDLSSGSLPAFSPSASSLTEPGTSAEQIDSDAPPSTPFSTGS